MTTTGPGRHIRSPRMPREDDIDEGPSDEDLERFSDATVRCPECGTTLYDDVELCYKCGHALRAGRSAMPSVKVAVIAIVLVIAVTGLWAVLVRWL